MKLRVKEIAERHGIRNANQLRDKTGLGVGTCYQLWDGTAQGIQLDTLNTLCNVLQVGPAMLFDYVPDVEQQPEPLKPSPARHSKKSKKER